MSGRGIETIDLPFRCLVNLYLRDIETIGPFRCLVNLYLMRETGNLPKAGFDRMTLRIDPTDTWSKNRSELICVPQWLINHPNFSTSLESCSEYYKDAWNSGLDGMLDIFWPAGLIMSPRCAILVLWNSRNSHEDGNWHVIMVFSDGNWHILTLIVTL